MRSCVMVGHPTPPPAAATLPFQAGESQMSKTILADRCLKDSVVAFSLLGESHAVLHFHSERSTRSARHQCTPPGWEHLVFDIGSDVVRGQELGGGCRIRGSARGRAAQ